MFSVVLFLEIIYLECQVLGIYKGGKNTKIDENLRAFYFRLVHLENKYPILDNISLYPI
jgi:hypothetical protein